jgi:hypothetical protein
VGRAYDIGDGMKQCQECQAVYHCAEHHSCIYYLQRLIRTIVGDTAYDRAQHNLESNININQKDVVIELGTMEELQQDYQKSFTNKLERQFESLKTLVNQEQVKLREDMHRIGELLS